MRVLNVSLDRRVFEKDSAVQKRLVALAEKTGEITVLAPGKETRCERIGERLTIQSVGGPKILQLLLLWYKGAQELRAKTYDLITVQDPYFLGLLGYLLSRRFGVSLEIQVHGLEKFSGLRKWLAGYVLKRAGKIRAVSNRLRDFLAKSYKLKANSLYVLPIYTQISVPPRTQKRNTVPYPFTFLSVGRLVPVKNIGLQIRALARVAKEIPHVRLRIVGDGPERANLELIASSLKLAASVVFEGEQKEMSRFYEEADAFLLTSDSEGWGLVVLEAAAHRLPLIMTDVGLAREVIKNGESGFIIPVGDEEELALAMRELIDTPELRVRLGEGAYRVFRALPGSEEHIQKQIEAWQALLKKK